ncbi:MAG: hypothetical protein A2Y40_06145 [Candidatus Margulisbacteria bacterium GWF2_35_9]|nr:MAG: hypothetical protein A2Y40_06145 [Candidatus Margulisbacteria bacterium GWF2_35_9]
MKKNLGSLDRMIRILLAALFILLYFTEIVGGWAGIVLSVIAVIFILTSFIGFCPLYKLFGISTCSVKK